MENIWKKPAILAVVAALVIMGIPMMAMNTAADGETPETYAFYVDLTADETLNGEWILGTGITPAAAFIDAANAAYGADNNVIAASGWITTLNGYSGAGSYGTPGYISWAQYGYVATAWDSDAYLGAGGSTNNQYAIFATEYISVAAGTYEDITESADEAAVLAAATYNGLVVVPAGYTAVAMSASDANANDTWDVIWYIMPTAQVASADEYVDSGWGYAQRDDTVGLVTLVNMQTIAAEDATMSASRNVMFTFSSAETSVLGYDVEVTYDADQLEFVSASNRCDLSFTSNGATAGVVSINGAGAEGVDGTSGLFSIIFSVKDTVADTDTVNVRSELVSMSIGSELSGVFPASYASVIFEEGEPLIAGAEVTVNAISDADGVAVTFDTEVLRFVSATNAIDIVIADGILTINTEATNTPVVITFVIVENPVVGETTVTANGVSYPFEIIASSFVIVPAAVGGLTNVSLYKVPAIAGFKMVFSYTGSAPTVSDLAGLSNMGSFSTSVNVVDRTLTVVWASPVNVDLNGALFSVSGMTTLTLTADDAELRFIIEDLSSVRANVGIAASLEDATNDDPNHSTDLNGDGSTDLADLIALMQYLADFDVSITVENADYHVDGAIDILDAMALQVIITSA